MLISILRGLKRATGDLNSEEVLKGGFICGRVKGLAPLVLNIFILESVVNRDRLIILYAVAVNIAGRYSRII